MVNPADLCPRPLPLPPLATTPHAPPIYPTSVWACESPQQADDMLAGRLSGYVYQRDGHPNAYLLAEKCRQLHSADRAAVTASGMGALAVAMFARYLFHTFPLVKLYLEVPGYNWDQVSSGEDRLFKVEGVLRDHEYYAGRAWDKYLCAIYPASIGGMSSSTFEQ